MPTFSAALLAGGESSRMGRDKALLPLTGSNLLLWQRQLSVLEELQPEEIFWSGAARPEMPAHVIIVTDAIEKAGPLAGIHACLNRLRSDLLVVLAVDLPQMNAAFLKRLLARCTLDCGAVARHDRFFEPLAAIYPKGMEILAAKHLGEGRLALQDILGEAEKMGTMQSVVITEEDQLLFKNLNHPHDLEQ